MNQHLGSLKSAVHFCWLIGLVTSGILRAYNGHVAEVKGGYSWSLLVTRGHTKTLTKTGFWGDFPEHPQRDSNPCRHLERVEIETTIGDSNAR